MSALKELEDSVAKLSETDYLVFKEWFWEFENKKWDNQIEKDILDNKLEALATKALQEFKAGNYKQL